MWRDADARHRYRTARDTSAQPVLLRCALWTAMKKGPPAVARSPCSPQAEHRGGPARNVARRTRSQSKEARHLSALRAGRAPRPARRPARRRLTEDPCSSHRRGPRGPVCAIVESMTGARLVHDTLEQEGWDVEIADAQKVKGLAPLACKTDKADSLVLATLSRRDLVPAIWLPDPRVRGQRELARFRMHLVKHESALRNRVHSTQRAKSRTR